MTDDQRIGAYYLLWVWETYGKCEHLCMSAGEDAMYWLESLGLAEDDGWGIKITAAGRELMQWDADGICGARRKLVR